MLLRRALVALALAGCGGGGGPTCKVGFIGDAAQAPEVQMLITDGASRMLAPVAAGQAVPLEPPPQGGYVLYVGAAARNVDGCELELRGTLRDPATGDQLGFDARNTDLVVGADGWGRSDPSNNANVANVNACPDYSPVDRQGGAFVLELEVVDRAGRRAKTSAMVTPVCALSSSDVQRDCLCTCSANYYLGKCDPARDGGAD